MPSYWYGATGPGRRRRGAALWRPGGPGDGRLLGGVSPFWPWWWHGAGRSTPSRDESGWSGRTREEAAPCVVPPGVGPALAALPGVPGRRSRSATSRPVVDRGTRLAGPRGVRRRLRRRLQPSLRARLRAMPGPSCCSWRCWDRAARLAGHRSGQGCSSTSRAAAAAMLPERWIWPAVGGAAAVVCGAGGSGRDGPPRRHVHPAADLRAHGVRLARHPVPVRGHRRAGRGARGARPGRGREERLRFSRDLHDLLGHACRSSRSRASWPAGWSDATRSGPREEIAEVEAVARRALAEVREAVAGYRQVDASRGAGRGRTAPRRPASRCAPPPPGEPLPDAVDARPRLGGARGA